MRIIMILFSLLLNLVVFSYTATATETPEGVTGGIGYTTIPAEMPEVVTGGVGEEEKQEIKDIEKNYSLKLVFTNKDGGYVSEVNVAILDTKGQEVVRVVTEGPFLLANLPAGTYRLEASADNHTLKRTLKVIKQELKTYYIIFPISEDIE